MTIIQQTMDFHPKSKHNSLESISPSRIRIDQKSSKPTTLLEKNGGNISISTFCILLEANGVHIGRNQMFKWLRENGYLSKQKNTWNMPHQRYVSQSLFAVKETFVLVADEQVSKYSPLLTPKGKKYLAEKLKCEMAPNKKLKRM